ncbi:hypothetical protein [Psychrobacillus sp. MER TA 171]|uniref:hypothetical protein n=1 Tax=Psychrobacillus sp. MER TA 171 TaxID=2939577 RepID=UPI00204042AB|nr:hypothetical protein [Psychrobacillus sp. MER TA 171]MCM3358041.1 hypothetical protein [Psychrobacillus sp. MER TA 171]
MKRIINGIFAITFFCLVSVFGLTATAEGIGLTQEQKEQYYQQYQKDLNDLKTQYEGQAVLDVSVAEFEYFEENGWFVPSEYKATVNEVITSKIFEVENSISTQNIVKSITKSFNVTNSKSTVIGKINATVAPVSAHDSDRGGMVLTSPGSILTSIGSDSGTWSQSNAGVSSWPQGQPYIYFPYQFTGTYTYQGVNFPFSATFPVSISKNGAFFF